MSNYYLTKDELYHHGILGQKWGIRRFQNADGTYTEAGLKRRQKFIDKETKLSNKKWDKKIKKADKKALKYYSKSEKASTSGNSRRAEKYDKKYSEAQKTSRYGSAMKKLEAKKINQMSLSDISKEKKKIGKEFVKDIALTSLSYAFATLTGSPISVAYVPNINAIKTDNRISDQEKIDILKKIK